MKIRRFVESLMREERIGVTPGLILGGLSLGYGAGVRLRSLLYRCGILRSISLPCKVVSVGNMTAGGTGKTPFVIFLSRCLQKNGKKVVILSRGYGGSVKDVGVVSDGKEIFLGPKEAGDEPYLMAKSLKGVPVVVGPDRIKTGLYSIEKFSPDIVMLDDGFQHIRLKRDLDIVLADAREGFGNKRLLPRGTLREPLDNIKRADIVFIKGGSFNETDREVLKRANLQALGFSYRTRGVYRIDDAKAIDAGIEFLKGKKVVALAGIANPESFFNTLKDTGALMVRTLKFPDHHPYTKSDIETIKESLRDAEMIVTTEKDGVRLKDLVTGLPLYILGIEVALDDEDGFKRFFFSKFKEA